MKQSLFINIFLSLFLMLHVFYIKSEEAGLQFFSHEETAGLEDDCITLPKKDEAVDLWELLDRCVDEEDFHSVEPEYSIPEEAWRFIGKNLDPRLYTLVDISEKDRYKLTEGNIGDYVAIRCGGPERKFYYIYAWVAEIIFGRECSVDKVVVVVGKDTEN